MSKSALEINKKFVEERALQLLEELDQTLSSDPEIIDSMSIKDVNDELDIMGAPPIKNLEGIISTMKYSSCDDEVDHFDLESDVVVRMPINFTRVKIRTRYLGRAKPKVVYEPLPDE